ncbi:MAG: hypothetical protein WCG38_20285 [Aestuariivirga sp.]
MFHVPWDMVQFLGGLWQADFGQLILIGIIVNRGDGRGAVVVCGADVEGVRGWPTGRMRARSTRGNLDALASPAVASGCISRCKSVAAVAPRMPKPMQPDHVAAGAVQMLSQTIANTACKTCTSLRKQD